MKESGIDFVKVGSLTSYTRVLLFTVFIHPERLGWVNKKN